VDFLLKKNFAKFLEQYSSSIPSECSNDEKIQIGNLGSQQGTNNIEER
jgi:hypothetical protein